MHLKAETYYFDVLVVGAGGAGLMAAMRASCAGYSVACVTKVPPTRSHTVAAKGGINAALGNIDNDDWRWHMYDTIRGGDWLADQDAVEFMCRNAPAAVRDLEHMGLPFSRIQNGKMDQRKYGGQSSEFGKGKPPHRACFVADRTGHAVLQTLYQASLKNKTQFFEEHFVVQLIMDEGVCRGVVAWDIGAGVIRILRAHMVILATGGYGQVYDSNTSSSICTGDGCALVLQAGLPLQDMEFVQFHPTGMYGSGFLITEAARGEGAYLINSQGERFMERYAPVYKDLASRDVIARAISKEIKEGRGCGDKKDHVLLCVSHLGTDLINRKLPGLAGLVKTFARIDPVENHIPVSPSAHYTMGGIPTDMWGQVQKNEDELVEGLMAIGEAACMSVHGANRLGCNSLLDIIVFGKACVEKLQTYLKPGQCHKNIVVDYASRIDKILSCGKNERQYEIISSLKSTMSNHAGVFRNSESMQKGLDHIKSLRDKFPEIKINNQSLIWNNELLDALELENLLDLGLITLESALSRKESRGSHYRDDYTDRNDKDYLKHSLAGLSGNQIEISYKNVRTVKQDSHIKAMLPEKRGY